MVVGLGSRRFFLYQPDSLVAGYVPVKDYSAMSVGEMRALATHGASSTLPASVPESLSVSQVREGLSDREAELNALKANIEDTKNGTSDELRALKEEVERAMAALEKKKDKLMAELSAKREASEKEHLDRSCPGFTEKYPSWMVDLSEWKLAEDVHSLHSRNVSRFLKWFAEKAERGEV